MKKQKIMPRAISQIISRCLPAIILFVVTGLCPGQDKIAELRKAAEKGDAKAQCILGCSYRTGIGVSKDLVEAVKWLRKAAEQGDAEAQYFFGQFYCNGDGVSKDPVEGVKWLRKAAEQGFAEAQYNLGCCYREGVGVTRNEVEALAWWNIVAGSGHKVAIQNRAMLESELGKEKTLAAQQRSKEILKEIEVAKTPAGK